MKIGENGFTLKETLLLSAAVGFFIIWAGEVFQGIPLKASYFWVMLSLASLLYFQYEKSQRLKAPQNDANDKKQSTTTPKKKKW